MGRLGHLGWRGGAASWKGPTPSTEGLGGLPNPPDGPNKVFTLAHFLIVQIRWLSPQSQSELFPARSENGEAGVHHLHHLQVSTSDSLRPVIANGGSQVQSCAIRRDVCT